MKIKNLFFLLLAMPLMMVACNNEGDKVVKDPTVIVTEGTATETSLSFSVTTTNAEVAAWVVVKSNETEPTAAEILNNGTAVEVNSVKQCTASDLEAGVEYVIVAAAKKGKTAVKSAPVKMTTSKSGDGPIDGPGDGNADVDFTATHLYGEFNDLDVVKNYLLVLGDKDYDGEQGAVVGGKYYMFNLYSSSANKGVIPAGTYSLATDPDAYQALTISPDGSAYFDTAVNGNMPTPYQEAMVVVSDNKIEATVQLSNGALHKVVYEGSLVFDESAVVETPSDFEATHTATKWLWGGPSGQWGNKYQVIGDNFSVDVHFMPENATATTLAEGEYTWVTTTNWDPQEEPYDFEFFTTRTFTVDNNLVPVDGGTVVVEKEGDEYHIELTLLGRDGNTYMIEYNGKITDPAAEGGDEGKTIVLTSFAKGVAVEGYDMRRYAAAADNGDVITFIINNTVAPNGDEIQPCNLTWMSISYAYNDTVFSTENIKIDGVSYKANAGSLKIETTDYKNIKLTANLTFANGMEVTYTFEGKIGGDETENPGEGGSDEPENPGEGGGDEPENPGEGGGDEPENPGEGGGDEPETPGEGGGDEPENPGEGGGDEPVVYNPWEFEPTYVRNGFSFTITFTGTGDNKDVIVVSNILPGDPMTVTSGVTLNGEAVEATGKVQMTEELEFKINLTIGNVSYINGL